MRGEQRLQVRDPGGLGVLLRPHRRHRRARQAQQAEQRVEAVWLWLGGCVGGCVRWRVSWSIWSVRIRVGWLADGLVIGEQRADVVGGVGVEEPLEQRQVAQRGGTQRGGDEARVEVTLRVEVQQPQQPLQVTRDPHQPLALQEHSDELQRLLRLLRLLTRHSISTRRSIITRYTGHVGVAGEGDEEAAVVEEEAEGDGEHVARQVLLHRQRRLRLTRPPRAHVVGGARVVQEQAEGAARQLCTPQRLERGAARRPRRAEALQELRLEGLERGALQHAAAAHEPLDVHVEAPAVAHRLLLAARLGARLGVLAADLLQELLLVGSQLLADGLLLLLAQALARHRHAALQEVALPLIRRLPLRLC